MRRQLAHAFSDDDHLGAFDIATSPGASPARLSNAVSWFAKSAPTAERRLELEHVAGQILLKPFALKEAA